MAHTELDLRKSRAIEEMLNAKSAFHVNYVLLRHVHLQWAVHSGSPIMTF